MAFIAWLALGVSIVSVVIYAAFVWVQTRTMKRQTKIMQESNWFPEAFFNAHEEKIYFRGSRPWFPEFRATMDGEDTHWWVNNFYPVEEDTQFEIEWYTSIPDGIGDFFSSFDPDRYTADLEFKFNSWTGEEYRINYELKLEVHDEEQAKTIGRDYQIYEYPSMELVLPWENERWI